MREMGVRGLLVYCSDYHCSHWTAISGDQWPDNVRLSDIEQRFTCQACGTKGADLRPNFSLGTRGWARGRPGFGSQGTLSIILVWFGCLAHVSACGSLRGPVRPIENVASSNPVAMSAASLPPRWAPSSFLAK